MKFSEFAGQIQLDPRAYQIMLKITMTDEEYTGLKKLFVSDFDRFFGILSKKYQNVASICLYLYLRMALELYPLFQERGISDTVYFDTMKDLAIWSYDCYRRTGVWGIREHAWFTQHLKMKLFRLGRLQFQPSRYHPDLFEKPLPENLLIEDDTEIWFVHIPEGDPLTEELCDDSYRQALTFFKRNEMHLFCDSWLLSPRLQDILKPESHILRFASAYQTLYTDDANQSVHKYLRPDSPLAIKISEYESSHGKIGSAMGYYHITQ